MLDLKKRYVNQKFPKKKRNLPESEIRFLYLRKRWIQAQRERLKLLPDKDIQEDPAIALTQRLNRGQLTLLNKILYYTQRYSYPYCSQQRLADETGYSKIQVHRLLKQFQEMGIVGKVHRGVKRTCLYYASPFFDLPWVQHSLRNILRCWLTLALGILFSIPSMSGYDKQVYRHGSVLNSYCHLPKSLSRQAGVQAGEQEHGTRVLNKGDGMEATVATMQPAVQHIWQQGQKDLQYGIPLTPKGCIKLNAFPVTVHRKVYQEYTKKWKQVREPFNWYMKRCMEISDVLGESPAWQQMYEHLNALGLDATSGNEVNMDMYEQIRRKMQQSEQRESAQKDRGDHENTSDQHESQRSPQSSEREYYVRASNARQQPSPASRPFDERVRAGAQALERMQGSKAGLAKHIIACMPEEVYAQVQQYQDASEEEE